MERNKRGEENRGREEGVGRIERGRKGRGRRSKEAWKGNPRKREVGQYLTAGGLQAITGSEYRS